MENGFSIKEVFNSKGWKNLNLVLLLGAFLNLSSYLEGAARKINEPFNPDNNAPRIYDFLISPNTNVPKIIYKANLGAFNAIGLYRVFPGGGPSLKISGDLIPGRDIAQFRISPDGTWTVFTAERDAAGVFELFSVSSDGGIVTKLNLNAKQQVKTFQITPDGMKAVYLADGLVSGLDNLFVAPIEGGAQALPITALVDPARTIQPNFFISSISNQVVYLSDQEIFFNDELYSAAIDGSGVFKINGTLAPAFDIRVADLVPNGSNVVYATQEMGDAGIGIYQASIFPPQSSVQLTITPGATTIGIKASASQVAYSFFTFPNTYLLGITSLDLGLAQIFPIPSWDSADILESFGFSENGHALFYTDFEGSNSKLFSLDVANPTNATPRLISKLTNTGNGLTNIPPQIDYISCSDSKEVIYRAAQEAQDRFEVYSAPIEGGVNTKLNDPVGVGGNVFKFQLSPTSDEGDQLIYLAKVGNTGVPELYSVGFDFLSDFDADDQNDILLRRGKLLQFLGRESDGQFAIRDFGSSAALFPGEKMGWVNDVDGDNRPDFSLTKGQVTQFHQVTADLKLDRNDNVKIPALPKGFRIKVTSRVKSDAIYVATKGRQAQVFIGATNVLIRDNEVGFKPIGFGEIKKISNLVLYNAKTRVLIGIPVVGVGSTAVFFDEPVSLGRLPKKFKKPTGVGKFFSQDSVEVITRQKKNIYLFSLPILAGGQGTLVGTLPSAKIKVVGPK